MNLRSLPRPFPWRSLDSTTRAEVAAFRDVRRWAAAHVRLDRLAAALAELVHADVELLMGRASRLASVPSFGPGCGVLLAPAEDPRVARGALLEVETALAAGLVARALRRPPPVFAAPGAASSADLAGSLAAVVLAVARRAHAETALRVLDAGSCTSLEPSLAGPGAEFVSVALTVLVDHDAFAARVIVSDGAAAAAPRPPWNAAALAELGPLPLAVPVVACATHLAAAEVAALGPGDALVPVPPAKWPLSRGAAGGLVGPVTLAPHGSAVGWRAELGEGNALVLQGGIAPLVAREATMGPEDKDVMAAAIGEVPVLVRVEIGEAVLSARAWASLGRGDVVALGRRVGQAVTLRVEGIALAHGELVDLEGEVAVRILERVAASGGAP